MAQQRPIPWMVLIVGMLVGSIALGAIGWRLSAQATERRISEKRASLKKLTLSGGIPPNQEVMDYLTLRQRALDARYRQWLKSVSASAVAETANADLQLYFQEQFHDVQRTLERLALARSFAVPELLGFPKDLPPSDTVPRLLVQLSLIRETATLMFEQGISTLRSLKIEDPEVVSEEGESAFLTRVPIRVRLSSSLAQLMKMLVAIERATPLVDLRELRVLPSAKESQSASLASSAAQDVGDQLLDVELVLARYLANESPSREEIAPSQAPGDSAKPRLRIPQEGKQAMPLQSR
jgi:hypothetical protein